MSRSRGRGSAGRRRPARSSRAPTRRRARCRRRRRGAAAPTRRSCRASSRTSVRRLGRGAPRRSTPSSGNTDQPMLPSISTAAPSTRNGRRSALRSRPTRAPARSSLPVPIERMTNSSPPTRATVSVSRMIASKRRASDFRTRSPARWPRTSFTSLKPSRSIAIRVNGSPERRERRKRLLDAIVEEHTVRKACQRIAKRLRVGAVEAPVEHHAGRGCDEREQDERGGDVVRCLAEDGSEEARAEYERCEAQRPCERASQLPPPSSDRHSLAVLPVAGAAAGTFRQ